MKRRIVIIGLSTTAERIYNFIVKHNLFDVIGFALDKEYIKEHSYRDLPIFDLATLESKIDSENDLLFVAIAWNKLNRDRMNVYSELSRRGFHFANIISPNSQIYSSISNENIWIGDNVIVETGALIGSNTFIDHNAYIGTHSIIKSHCYLGAKSLIAGKCIISEQCFIGLNATVFDEITIGRKCIIGACTIIKRNIPEFSIVKTNLNLNVIIQSNSDEIETKLDANKNKR